MKTAKIFGFLLMLGVACAWSQSAEAANAYGVWRSSSGNIFYIPKSYSAFIVVLERPDGRTLLLKGRWKPGLRGYSFNYWGNAIGSNQRCSATFHSDSPNRLRAVCRVWFRGRWRRRGVSGYWRRAYFPRSGAYSAHGEWRSTSGNIFNIPQSNRRFMVIMRNTNGSRQIANGRWVPGRRGYQFEYWVSTNSGPKRCRATFYSAYPHRLSVRCKRRVYRYGGRRTIWTPTFYWRRVVSYR